MSNSGDSDGDRIPPKNLEDVQEEVAQKLLEAFKAFDREGTGSVSSSDLKLVIEMMGIKMDENEIYKIIADVDAGNTGSIAYSDVKGHIIDYQVERIMGSDETELLDAYVAMGGDADGGGCVDAQKLITTIKNEF